MEKIKQKTKKQNKNTKNTTPLKPRMTPELFAVFVGGQGTNTLHCTRQEKLSDGQALKVFGQLFTLTPSKVRGHPEVKLL